MMTVFSHISRPASPEGTGFSGPEILQTCIFKGLGKKEDVSEERSNNQTETLRDTLISILYMLSGCCGLIYQTVWIRKFSLVFGSTIFSMSIVIAVFFGGLAIGSRLFGKLSTRTKLPVRVYAILEIIISLYALAFPKMLEGIELVYASIYSSVCHNFIMLVLVKSLLSCFLLLLNFYQL